MKSADPDRAYWLPGTNNRKVGKAQAYVVEAVNRLLDEREEDRTEFAGSILHLNTDLLRQFFAGRARLPMKRAYAWADALDLKGKRRDALLRLFAIANAHGLILDMIGDWEALVDREADILVGGDG